MAPAGPVQYCDTFDEEREREREILFFIVALHAIYGVCSYFYPKYIIAEALFVCSYLVIILYNLICE